MPPFNNTRIEFEKDFDPFKSDLVTFNSPDVNDGRTIAPEYVPTTPNTEVDTDVSALRDARPSWEATGSSTSSASPYSAINLNKPLNNENRLWADSRGSASGGGGESVDLSSILTRLNDLEEDVEDLDERLEVVEDEVNELIDQVSTLEDIADDHEDRLIEIEDWMDTISSITIKYCNDEGATKEASFLIFIEE